MTRSLLSESSSTQQEFLRLLLPFQGKARGLAWRLAGSYSEGDDLFQEAILRALSRFSSLQDDSKFRPWFYRILLSVHRNSQRNHFWRWFVPFSSEDNESKSPFVFDQGEGLTEEKEKAKRASQALAILPPVQKEAIVLFDLLGHSLEEVAELQGASLSAVKSRLVRGRKRLKRYYEKLGFGPGKRSEEKPSDSFSQRNLHPQKEMKDEYPPKAILS